MMIGELSKKTGVSIETIRFYERENLIKPLARKESGYRTYNETAISRLKFIKRSKDLGFSLKEIGELLSLNSNRKSRCHSVKIKAEKKVEEIQIKISDLTRMRTALKQLIDLCYSEEPSSECPILDTLKGNINE